MCFSVQVDQDIHKLARRFKASVNEAAFGQFSALIDFEHTAGLKATEAALGLAPSSRRKSPIFKLPTEDGRVFSNTFTNVIVSENGQRSLRPMRYRVRPNGSKEEIPTKYNVFNARIDALESRQTWTKLFMHQHGLVPFVRFYEWVESRGKKELLSFRPETHEIMWAPCLWDEWTSHDKKITFRSFAIITDDPPPEIQEVGHDRCPIFLAEQYIDVWLEPKGKSKKQVYQVLKELEPTVFQHLWAA